MSRSSLFGLAISSLVGLSFKEKTSLTMPRSKIETGEKSSFPKRRRE